MDDDDNDICQENLFEYIKQAVVFAGYFSVYYFPDFFLLPYITLPLLNSCLKLLAKYFVNTFSYKNYYLQ
jgi:hypothetical protein